MMSNYNCNYKHMLGGRFIIIIINIGEEGFFMNTMVFSVHFCFPIISVTQHRVSYKLDYTIGYNISIKLNVLQ